MASKATFQSCFIRVTSIVTHEIQPPARKRGPEIPGVDEGFGDLNKGAKPFANTQAAPEQEGKSQQDNES